MPGVLVLSMPFDVEPTQLSIPEPPASSVQVNWIGTGRCCVNTWPSENPVRLIVGLSVSIMNVLEPTADVLPLKSVAIHFSVASSAIEIAGGSARARSGFHSVEAVVGELASVEGEVQLRGAAAAEGWRPAAQGDPVCRDDTVRTGKLSRAAVALVNDAVLGIDHTLESALRPGDRITLVGQYMGGAA